jgi:hypothetical protein
VARKNKLPRKKRLKSPYPTPLTEREKRAYLKQHLAIIKKIEPKKLGLDPNKTIEDLAYLFPLRFDERHYIAEALRRQWLPKHELRAYWRQLRLQQVEATKFILKHFSKQTTAQRADTAHKFHDFPSVEAMERFRERERPKRKR